MSLKDAQEIAATSLRPIGDAIVEIGWAAAGCNREIPFKARIELAIGMLALARDQLELALEEIRTKK